MYLSHQRPHVFLAAGLLRFAYAVENIPLRQANTSPRTLCPSGSRDVQHWANGSNLSNALAVVGGDQTDREDYNLHCSMPEVFKPNLIYGPYLVEFSTCEQSISYRREVKTEDGGCSSSISILQFNGDARALVCLSEPPPCKRSLVGLSPRSP